METPRVGWCVEFVFSGELTGACGNLVTRESFLCVCVCLFVRVGGCVHKCVCVPNKLPL